MMQQMKRSLIMRTILEACYECILNVHYTCIEMGFSYLLYPLTLASEE